MLHRYRLTTSPQALRDQGIEHSLDAIVVGKDDRVVKDDWRPFATASQHPRKRQPN